MLPNPDLGLRGQDRETTLALCLWQEARGEPVEGMAAVACVILNRAKKHGKDVKDVVIQPWQFSGFNVNHAGVSLDPNGPKSLTPIAHGPAALWERAAVIAKLALAGCLADNTGGASHYFNPAVVQPEWAEASRGWKQTVEIGSHLFGNAA
jgi:N-acetylmuramoyl-L-alanine amidase